MLFDKVQLKNFTPIRKKVHFDQKKSLLCSEKNSCTVPKTVQFVQKKVLKNKFSSFSKKVHFVRKKGSCSVQKKKFSKKVHFV